MREGGSNREFGPLNRLIRAGRRRRCILSAGAAGRKRGGRIARWHVGRVGDGLVAGEPIAASALLDHLTERADVRVLNRRPGPRPHLEQSRVLERIEFGLQVGAHDLDHVPGRGQVHRSRLPKEDRAFAMAQVPNTGGGGDAQG